MKKKLDIPDFMTGKQIANLLHHKVKRLKWRQRKLGDSTFGYCALGQIARLGGVSNETLAEVDSDHGAHVLGYGVHSSYGECSAVFDANDYSDTKEKVVQRLCKLGDHQIPVGKFVAALRNVDRHKGRVK